MALGWKVELNRCGSDRAFALAGENLEGCVHALEEERRKIEAFKRELPLCMQIITDALDSLKLHLAEQQQEQQQQQQQHSGDASTASSLLQLSFSSYTSEEANTKSSTGVLEEFIPSKTSEEESTRDEKVCDTDLDKPSWMAQVQLWSQEQQKASPTRPQAKHAVPGIFRNSGGGAFSPFVKASAASAAASAAAAGAAGARSHGDEQVQAAAVRSSTNETGLTLSSESSHRSGAAEETRATVGTSAEKRMEATSNPAAGTSSSGHETNSQRKARRCWSPELHRRFLNALQQLGGSHAATPKQIREIMKVDGLTNDEVKSHLQKYRLHTRRPAAPSSGSHEPGAQVVVLGGIWASEFAAASLQQNPTAAAAFYRSALAQQQGSHENKTPSRASSQDRKSSGAAQEQQDPEQEQHQGEETMAIVVEEGKKKQESRSSNPDEEMDDGDVTENEDNKNEGRQTTLES